MRPATSNRIADCTSTMPGGARRGGYRPAAAPFTVAIHPESVPPGLHLRASSAYGGDSFVVEAQSLYPVQVSLNFAAGKTD